MPELKLTGLRSGSPIGFMAALGAFRHAAAMYESVRLGWTEYSGEWCALLHTGELVDADRLANDFAARIKSIVARPEFQWAPALKDLSPAGFRSQAESSLGENTADWFQAFGSELPVTRDGKLESTPFDMTVARQQFLADAEWLTRDLATPDPKRGDRRNIDSFREAIFGPWKYQDNQHSLGWDPSTILMGAFTPKAPTAMNKSGVRAAVWLAMEALPFFPCFYSRGLATTGFRSQGRNEKLVWAIWETPVSMQAVRTLLQHSVALDDEERQERGIVAVYSSEIFKPNKYLTSFQPAVLSAGLD